MTTTMVAVDARALADAVGSVPGVARLIDPGAGGSTFVPGERVRGVRVDRERATVHVAVDADVTSVVDVARAVRDAVRSRFPTIELVDVHVDDLADAPEPPPRERSERADGASAGDGARQAPVGAPPLPPPSSPSSPAPPPRRTPGSAPTPIDRRSHHARASTIVRSDGGSPQPSSTPPASEDRVVDAAAAVADAAKSIAEAAAVVAAPAAPDPTGPTSAPSPDGRAAAGARADDVLGDEPVGTSELTPSVADQREPDS